MDNTKELRTISLCTGYGGIERGLELCGERIKPIVTCEIEAYAIALNLKRMESGEVEAHPIWSNLKTFPVDCIPEGYIDLLTGGYPCQPFSSAGKRLGKDDPRHLWPYIADIIRAVKPIRCFFENVEGHITKGLREVIAELESLGYRTTWGIFSAEEVGAPHRRKRVFILGELADTKHNGPPSTAIRRSVDETSYDNEKGKEESSEFKGDGQSESLRDLQRGELADPRSEGLQGRPRTGIDNPQGWETPNGYTPECGVLWPARPGEDQASWEEPRTQPRLGQSANGTDHKIDRLRMLGNGVVPQTAARAWEVLNARFER